MVSGVVKGMWASAQGGPVFMRRSTAADIFWIGMIPISVATGWVKASCTSRRCLFGRSCLDTGRHGKPPASRSNKQREAGNAAKRDFAKEIVDALVEQTKVRRHT